MKKLILSAILCGFAMFSFAQEEKQPAQQPASKEVAALRMAHSLAKYGYENYSASSLIEAARIIAQTPTHALEAQVTKGEASGKVEAKTNKPEFTPANLLADAKKIADGDATLLALANQVEKLANETETRGRVEGPGRTVTTAAANSTDTFVIRFRTNELAEILVSGDGDTDLDLYVYDSSGNLIEKDDDYSDDCYVRWVPKWTGAFTVKVANRGGVYNKYIMLTN